MAENILKYMPALRAIVLLPDPGSKKFPPTSALQVFYNWRTNFLDRETSMEHIGLIDKQDIMRILNHMEKMYKTENVRVFVKEVRNAIQE